MKMQYMAFTVVASCALAACGGGGGKNTSDSTPSGSGGGSVISLSVTAPTLVTSAPTAGVLVQFSGGVCGGGVGQLTSKWSYGDGTISTTNSHTYQQAGSYSVSVTCTDANNDPAKTSTTLTVKVSAPPVAKTGFLANTWTVSKVIDPANTSLYPVAAMSDDGVVQGLWLKNVTVSASTVASGQLTTNPLSGWSLNAAFDLVGATSPFNNYLYRTRPAPIDMAVSPDGHAFAAWIAGGSLWYTVKSSAAAWALPVKLAVNPTENVLKVVVSNQGNAAIGYCNSSGAQVINYRADSKVKCNTLGFNESRWSAAGC